MPGRLALVDFLSPLSITKIPVEGESVHTLTIKTLFLLNRKYN